MDTDKNKIVGARPEYLLSAERGDVFTRQYSIIEHRFAQQVSILHVYFNRGRSMSGWLSDSGIAKLAGVNVLLQGSFGMN